MASVDPVSLRSIDVLRSALGPRGAHATIQPWSRDGQQWPGLFTWQLGTSRSLVLVHEGRCVEPGAGEAPIQVWLSSVGFPAHPVDPITLGVVLRYAGVIVPPWFPDGLDVDAIEAHYRRQDLEPPSLEVGEDGVAVFVVEARVKGRFGGGYMPAERHTTRLRLDPAGWSARVQRIKG